MLENLWPAWVDFRRAFLMSSSVLLLSLISSCCVFTSRSFCLSARALRAYSDTRHLVRHLARHKADMNISPVIYQIFNWIASSISFCVVFPIICIVFPISAEIKVYKCWPISHQYRKLIKSPKWIVTLCQDYHPLLLLWLILSKNSNAFVFFLTKQL